MLGDLNRFSSRRVDNKMYLNAIKRRAMHICREKTILSFPCLPEDWPMSSIDSARDSQVTLHRNILHAALITPTKRLLSFSVVFRRGFGNSCIRVSYGSRFDLSTYNMVIERTRYTFHRFVVTLSTFVSYAYARSQSRSCSS